MKILITHVYSQHNKGDLAILSAMIDQVSSTFKDSDIKILTAEMTFPKEQDNESTVSSFFYYCLYQNKRSIFRILNTIHILTSSLIWAFIHRISKVTFYFIIPQRIHRTCKAYFEADFVLPVGGGYISGKNTLQSHMTLLIQLHAIVIATLLRKKTVLYSQSIGPFSNSFQTTITRIVLNRVDAIYVREDHTISTLEKIGVKKNLMHRTFDAAFLFTSDQKEKMKKELESLGIKKTNKLIGITVRKWLVGEKQHNFEKQIAIFADYLAKKENATVVFIPQVTSHLHNDDDREVNKSIEKILGEQGNIFFLDKKYDHFQIKSIYENLDYLIGTRMHSVIFSLTGNIPSIAIEYEYKTSGIMSELGLSDYVIKIEDVTSQKLIKLFKNLEKNKDNYKKILNKSLNTYIQKSKNMSTHLKKIYEENEKPNVGNVSKIDLSMDNVLSYFRKPAYITLFYLRHPLSMIEHMQKNLNADNISGKVISTENEPKVSIVIVTYNALDSIKICLESLQKTKYKNKEVVVIDNNSSPQVQEYLKDAKSKNLIQVIYFSKVNTFFTGGNNLGAAISSKNSQYIVFLNSDTEIKDKNWLSILIANKPKKGIISFGKVDIPVIRPDGWCFMVDKKTYLENDGLNEYYKMDWGITEFTGRVLKAGFPVKSIVNPNDYVYHYGQKSRPKKSKNDFNKMTASEVMSLFDKTDVTLLRA